MPFIPNTDQDRREMLSAIGVKNFEELLKTISPQIRLKDGLNLPEQLSEFEVTKELQKLAAQNKNVNEVISFLGGGSYDHYIPAAVGALLNRSEFYTAYTPYQAEVSQGTLQAIYEYQTMICNLTGMDVANASMYDGGSALGEAVLLSIGHSGRNEVVLVGKVHPSSVEIIKTYCEGRDIVIRQTPLHDGTSAVETLEKAVSEKTAAIVVQQPNFYGLLEPVFEIEKVAHHRGALYIVSVDPISLGILAPPGQYGADVVVGEGQSLGISLNFGGPYLGIFAVKEFLVRKIPGRLSGITVDADGQRGFTLTIQTREQHIRREKATSNICTNQGLMMVAACIYLSLMGKQGVQEVASLCLQKSHYLASAIPKLKGYKLKYSKPFFKEFVIQTPKKPSVIIAALLQKGIFAGLDISRFNGVEEGLLIAVTEKRTKEEMDRLIDELAKV